MAYSKITWNSGDVITAEKLNNIEEAVEDVSLSVDDMASSIAKIDNIESTVESLNSEIASARNYNSSGTANTLGGRIDELVRISNTQPGGNNEIWVNSGNNVVETEVPTYEEFNELKNSNAPEYSNNAIYAVGEYVFYNGNLYRCQTAITTAETWNDAHWTQVNFGAELYDMDTSMHHHDMVFPRNGGRVAVAPATSGAITVTVPRYLVRVHDRAAVNIDLGAADNAYTVPDGSALIMTGYNTLVVGTLNAYSLGNNGNCILLYNDRGVPCGQWGVAAKADKAEVEDLKSALTVKTDFTAHVISINGNYLNSSDLNIVGKYFYPKTGAITDGSYTCGYIRFPCPGAYKLHQSVDAFGTQRLFVPLFKGDKTYYKTLAATALDDYIINFSITDEDAENAVYIGVSYRPNKDPVPMLILNGDYPASRHYTAPMYDFPDLKNMRYMGVTPVNLDTLVTGGWFSGVSNSTHTTLPSDFNSSAGAIMIFPTLFNASYAMQVLLAPSAPITVWTRYVAMDGTSQSAWSKMPNRVDTTLAASGVPADSAAVGNKIAEVKSYVNNARLTDRNISLSGNYLDYKNADWQVGYDTGTSILQTSGYHYAFIKLLGPGTYIRVMRNVAFGVTATRVALYDKNKTYIKYVSATRIESTDGFGFELTADDAMSAVYTTVSYQDTHPNVVGLFYESDAYPLKVGLQAALPNYKPVSDPLYKCTFICDGDSICQAATDQPKYACGWWGRVVLDYSADGKNYGVGGGTITSGLYYENGNPRHWINESIDTIYSEYPALDYLILEGGTNDADLIGKFNGDTAPAKFGTWSETDFSGDYDNTTFCGAVDTMFYKATTYWPKAKIGFIIAMQMGTNNASSANRRRYFNEIEAIAKKWHIPVLDLWNKSQMDARLTAYYDPSMTGAENVAAGKCYYDGQHPTSYGYDLMQGKIDAWIHTL